MGVYIPKMETPKNCCQCPVNMEVCKRGYEYLLAHPELYDKRADDCPLVPVQPHGRLIDGDALTETTDGVWDCNDLYFQPNDKLCDPSDCKGCKWRETMDCFRRMVKHAPTIIPAEESQHG